METVEHLAVFSHLEASPSARIYAIGDVHGCVEELDVLLSYLVKEEQLSPADSVVFLGDYIDRGESSRQVIDLLLSFRQSFPRTRCLKGNHEAMLLEYLFGDSPVAARHYLACGGTTCLASYGLEAHIPPSDAAETFPPNHLEFFGTLEVGIVADRYVLIHAGLNPSRALTEQVVNDCLWIREGFLANAHPFNKLVVFGHTPMYDVFLDKPFKLGIDTGLVFGNKLSCVELTSERLLQVKRNAVMVDVTELVVAA